MKSAIITGASRGIGAAVARHLVSLDYHVLLLARHETALATLATELRDNSKATIHYAVCDVFDEKTLGREVQAFVQQSGLSLLINNAGYVKRGTHDLASNELAKMLDTNLVGAVNVIQSVLPTMLAQQSGYIINIASRSAVQPRPQLGGYAASKAGLLAYSESLYQELAETGIKITTLCPGFVDTEMTSGLPFDRSLLIPPTDICTCVDFLLNLSSSTCLKALTFESIVQVASR